MAKAYIVICNFVILDVFGQPLAAERSAKDTMERLSAVTWRSVAHRKWAGESGTNKNKFYVEIEEHEVK